jgi:hypothetical protein
VQKSWKQNNCLQRPSSFAFVLHFETERFTLPKMIDMENTIDNTENPQHDAKPLVSSCCFSANMIEPDWEMAEEAGSLWRAYACYICRECGKACDTVKVDKQ